jgi:triacylglycerol esterase/lipase EstA (alpha/beta hydrolase family)
MVSRLGMDEHIAAVVTIATPHRGSALADFCHGLIEGCVTHFGETARIDRRERVSAGQTEADFRIKIETPA